MQATLTTCVATVLKPVVRLILMTGLSWTEFLNVAKAVFVEVASEEYGLRGRLTNISRVAAMTGLSRKEIKRIRSESVVVRWAPSMEQSPANTVMHYWHHDPDFCSTPGKPMTLPLDGPRGFAALVKRYGGDIPPGAMRTELLRVGAACERADKSLEAAKLFTHPSNLYEDFLRNIAFAWSNLGNTLAHNVGLLTTSSCRDSEQILSTGRFERSAWTEHLRPVEVEAFRRWVREQGTEFVERADHWIGQNEAPMPTWDEKSRKTIGVGLYYFEEE